MADIQALLNELRGLANAWRSGDGRLAPRGEVVEGFQRALDQLYAAGWNDVLGWSNELPDEFLPQRYIGHRTERIDELENELARFSMGWRKTREHPERQSLYYEAYKDALEELFRIGHWSGEPDAESQLPFELMPSVYKEFWRAKLAK